MKDNCTIKTGNVVLVDPNCVNINTNQINSIPQYQDMFIHADLIATRRGRTIIFNGGATTDKSVTVNLMGFNQNEKSPNYQKFTTNYYDGSTGKDRQYESFGIRSIKASINSSFIPQVNIEFVDIRGLSFFNQGTDKETSPYRILFDFPPPIFELTIKGYYGKALRYKLHLVNYTSEFNSDNGNFVINANFVAITFAPLSDILFRYVVNFPLIISAEFDPNPGTPPNNTYELILKVQNLITATNEFKKDSIEKQNYDNVVERIEEINKVISFFAGSLQSSKLEDVGEPAIFFIREKSDDSNVVQETDSYDYTNYEEIIRQLNQGGVLTQIESLSEYNNLIIRKRVVGSPINMEQRLFIGYKIGETSTNEEHPEFDGNRVEKMRKGLDKLRTELINQARGTLGGADIYQNKIKNVDTLVTPYNLEGRLEDKVARFIVLDVTDFYLYLYKLLNDVNEEKTELINVLNTAINNMVLKELGILPTIYNIFEIILNDVDKFFNILRITSVNADTHHNLPNVKPLIVGGNLRDIGMREDEKIYPFPLVIRNKSQCNRLIEERIAPIELSNSMAATFGPFPELVLVNDFINTFRRQANLTKQYRMLLEKNTDGTNVWIPLSPFDSRIGTVRINTPYIGIDSSGGGLESQPIPMTEDSRINAILKIFLRRYYVLSQFVYPLKFVGRNVEDRALIQSHAHAEAINLAISVFNRGLRDNLKTFADTYKGITGLAFIQYIATNIPELYSDIDGNTDYVNAGRAIYVNKNDANYVGCRIYTTNINLVEVNIDTSGSTPIARFRKEIKGNKINRFFNGKPSEEYLGYVEENLFYIRDGVTNNGRDDSQGTILKSRFCLSDAAFPADKKPNTRTIRFRRRNVNKISTIQSVVQLNPSNNRYGGNDALSGFAERGRASKLNAFGDVMEVWSVNLGHNSERIFNKIFDFVNPNSGFNEKLSSILLLSNFGLTASPFNVYWHGLNEYVFTIPAVINVPTFLPLYVGSLVGIEIGDDTYNEIYEFFVSGDGNNFTNGGIQIFADIADVNQKLSVAEKERFKNIYDNWYRNGAISFDGNRENTFGELITNMYAMYQEFIGAGPVEDKVAKYKELLSPNGNYYSKTLQRLLLNNYILNFSELTFKYNDLSQERYFPMSPVTPNTGFTTNRLNRTGIFFGEFFDRLSKEIVKVSKNDRDERLEAEKLTGDKDIITQTYYSFKNINDKWLVEPAENSPRGYPFNGVGNDRLINLFAFVDRGMNPVGDTMINPEALIELGEDTDISVFSVLSTLLSTNHFEFFPLQNFMLIDYDESEDRDDWSQSFKIDTTGRVKDSPFFVCMYIGGSSRMITGIDRFGDFQNDGIIDLSIPSGHFTTDDCSPLPDKDRQVESNPNFPWGEVRAFRVRFAEQNQSMFKEMRIESKEFPETNESIQILSRLAGDNRINAPIPKGQNLFNIYENRAYSASITGLGNAMIQPTQYFQLENVPLFNGAYLILNVEHTIEPNKMVTTFSGTKILKYPIPRVTSPAAILGFDGADAETTSAGRTSAGGVILGAGTAGNPREAKYNSMYTQQIKQNG